MYIRGELFGIVDRQFHQFLTELSAHHIAIFSFSDDNLVFALILWKSGLGLLMSKFHSKFSAHHTSMFSFLDDNFSKY